MLSVCLIFLYVLVSTYLTGFYVLHVIGRLCGAEKLPQVERADGYVMAGLAAVTVYAQFFSLFYKVGLMAEILLAVFCVVTAVILRRPLIDTIRRQYKGMTRRRKIFYLLLFLFMAYGTSRGVIHYDTGLYHAQSIRWIEEFGVVKGLGNLHCRLAYNSSSFSLSALYSFAFLGGQSYHCMAGFMALLLAKVCSEITHGFRRRKLMVADYARLMGIYYLLIIYDEMVSPASDYFMVLTVFYIVIRYLELAGQGEKSWFLYGLLSLLCVYVLSIKLSAALIVLLVIKPALQMIKEKKVKEILFFTGLGVLIMLPFLIRNVIISGWLVYPFTVFDFLDADWKIPAGLATYDAMEIQVWGRGLYDVAAYNLPVSEWFPAWFHTQGRIDRLFVIAGIAAVPLSAAALIYAVRRKKTVLADCMLAAAVINGCFLFWLVSAPLIRYGCVYLWLAPTVTFAALAVHCIPEGRGKQLLFRMVYAAVGIAGCYKAAAFGIETVTAASADFLLVQKDYENFETHSYEIEGNTFYYPVEGDRVGYEAFPSAPGQAEIELRGEKLEDGFRYKQENKE